MSSKTSLSALMAYVNMQTTLLFALVVISIQAWNINDCEEYCRTSSIKTTKCDCSLGNPILPRAENILPEFYGIYYEPANPVQKLSFVEPPFYVINPNVRFNVEEDSLMDTGKLVTRRFDIPSSDGNHGKVKYSKVHVDKMNVDNNKKISKGKELPLYIDVSSKVSINKDRAGQKKLDSISDAQLKEKDLLECLDLHLLACSLQKNNVNDLKEAWNSNNFKMYGKLTKNGLKNEIIRKCSKPAKALKESLIKGKMLHKNGSINKTSEKLIDEKENHTLYQYMQYTAKTETTTENSAIMQSIFPSEDRSGSINNLTNKKMPSTLTETINFHEDINNNSKKRQSDKKESIQKLDPRTTVARDINNVVGKELTYQIEENNLHTTDNKTDLNSTDFNSHPLSANELRTKVENILATKTNLGVEFLEENVHRNDSFILGNGNSERINEELKDTVRSNNNFFEDDITIPSHLVTSNETRKNTSNTEVKIIPLHYNNILLDYVDSNTTNKTVSTDHNIILETQPKIPKIITIEFPNDTVVSNINGIEQIPNNDFVIRDTYTDNLTVAKTGQDLSGRMILNDSTSGDHESENTTKIMSKINGKLVFIFGEQNIPAHFVQNTDGNIQLGIDGPALCEKLEFLSNNSVLLTVLCNCFRFNNCTNNIG